MFLICSLFRVGRETMIGYVTLGTGDLERAAAFYDALAVEMVPERTMEFDGFIAWGRPGGTGVFLTPPFDGQPASVGNGTMVGLAARDQARGARAHDTAH